MCVLHSCSSQVVTKQIRQSITEGMLNMEQQIEHNERMNEVTQQLKQQPRAVAEHSNVPGVVLSDL
jgi:hypothetical protein